MSLDSDQGDLRNQIILDSIAEGVFTVDLSFRITSFNRAAERITRIDRGQALGQACRCVFKASVCDGGCLLAQVMETGRAVVDRPIRIVRGDRRQIPVSANAALLRNAGGRVIGGVETFRDLTTEDRLRRALNRRPGFDDILSKNLKMQKIFGILPRIAESRSTVLIQGDSGTGKELVARAIHHHSPQRKGPFVAVNCGALPDSLCESELFGYKAGAFTDARKDKPGRFARAENGTIFLDEIGDVSPAMQSRMLRVLEERVYEPLGSTRSVRTNARIITATNRDLAGRVQEGAFREDFYFRINVIRIHLPPLSERREDIPLLVDHFIEGFNRLHPDKAARISHEAMAALLTYGWPGNVRELKNAIEQAMVLCGGERIEARHLPEALFPSADPILPAGVGLTLREIEKRAIEHALRRNANRSLATARELGVDKNTLRRKIRRLGIVMPV